MKESRRNCREPRVQDDDTTENTNARSPLTQRKLEKRFAKVKYSSSLEISCPFLVHLPNS